jgi:hypothetical protein
VIRRKPKRQCRIYLSTKKFSQSVWAEKNRLFPSPLKPAMVTEASKSQLSLLSHPGPPHLSADMYDGRPTEAHAWGHRRRRVRNEYTNCKTSFVRVSHVKETERCERSPYLGMWVTPTWGSKERNADSDRYCVLRSA